MGYPGSARRRWHLAALAMAVISLVWLPPAAPIASAARSPSADYTYTAAQAGGRKVYLPMVTKVACQPTGQGYGTVTVTPHTTNADSHPDINLGVRGYQVTNAYKGLVDYNGAADGNAPQLAGLFAGGRGPSFRTVYQVYSWDWANKTRGSLITSPPVTLAGLTSTQGETVHVPNSGYTIGLGISAMEGYEVLVLYATDQRITLKYTREDNVIYGYTLHVENVCVDPSLVSLYQQMNAAGRTRLPALYAGQAFGRARGPEVGVAIRDAGTFLDPRSRKDWWRGY